MTDFTNYRSSRRDQQDHVERGTWGAREDVAGAGSIMSVKGTGTVDLEVPIFNLGYSFNLPADSDAEVLMLALGSDVNDKIALPQIPRSAQRQWPVNTGGVQHPTDAGRYVEFNENETHLNDGTFVIGSNREVTIVVDGTSVVITTAGNATVNARDVDVSATGNMNLTAAGVVEISSPILTHNGTDIGDTHTHGGVDTGFGNTGAPT